MRLNVSEELLLKKLNDPQKEAVKSIDGPLLIIAGPGSGKTRVITYRYAYILYKKPDITPQNILSVTFTNKAAEEMKERISTLLGIPKKNIPWVRTFHSTGLQILRKHAEKVGLSPDFSVYDEEDAIELIKYILEKMNIEENENTIYKIISHMREKYIYEDVVEENLAQINVASYQLLDVYREYKKTLKKSNAVDFSDLVVLPIYIFRKYPEVLKEYAEMWKYVMVDEFQDTNNVLYEFIKLIGKYNGKNIAVVGDDDQAIYGWRGAVVDNMFKFREDFQPKVVILDINYRSTKTIITAASKVAEKLGKRFNKELITFNEEGEPIKFFVAENKSEEAEFVAYEIKKLMKSGVKPEEIAVFYRMNYQSRELEKYLRLYNIPYQIIGNVSFFERKEIKDILAYIKFFSNPNDVLSFRRIVNVPKRGIGDATINNILDEFVQSGDILEAVQKTIKKGKIKNSKQYQGLQTFLGLSEEFRFLIENQKSGAPIYLRDIISSLVEKINYYEYLKKSYPPEEAEDRYKNIEELINMISSLETEKGEPLKPDEFLQEIAIYTSGDDPLEKTEGKVSLMTLHQSKGLEFEVVFIIGVNDGIIPHRKSISGDDGRSEDEERRLFYVGMTRAKKLLYLIHYRTEKRYERENFLNGKYEGIREVFYRPSRYIYNIPEELIDKIL